MTSQLCSRRWANVRPPAERMSLSSDAGPSPTLADASVNSEIGRIFFGMNTTPQMMQAVVKVTTRTMAAGDQMVVLSGMMPVVFSRKCPGVAINSGALPDSPNCQIAPTPASVERRKRKSTGSRLRSASFAK